MKKNAQRNDKIKKMKSAEAKEQHGICPSCENFILCSFIYPEKQPIFFCEEFASSSAQAISVAVNKQPAGTADQHPSEKYNGLCANCKNAHACVYPQDEAGIWQCEEYK